MSNTLGAMVFLGAGIWLGWQVLNGKAQRFLAAMSGAQPPSGGVGSLGTPTPSTAQGGALQGVNLGAPSSPFLPGAPVPNVFGGAFHENGASNASPYGVFSPLHL